MEKTFVTSTCKKCGKSFKHLKMDFPDLDYWKDIKELCFDCFYEKPTLEAREKGLPDLEGTKTQLYIANSIRLEKMEIIDAIAQNVEPDQRKRFEKMVNALKAKVSAEFWVNNRSCEIHFLLFQAIGKEIDWVKYCRKPQVALWEYLYGII